MTARKADSEEGQKSAKTCSEGNMEKSCIKALIGPVLFSMALAGFYSFSEVNQHNKLVHRRKRFLSFAYRLVLFIMVLIFFVKKVSGLFYLQAEMLLFDALFSLWLLLCLALLIIFWRAFNRSLGKQIAAFETWNDTIIRKFQELNLEYPATMIRRRIKALLVFGFILICSNTIGASILFVLPTNLAVVFTSPLETNGITIAAFCVFQLVCSAVWVMPIIYAAAIACVLKHGFTVVKDAIRKAVKMNACSVPSGIQKLRVLHIHLCTLVSEFDLDLRWYYGAVCTCKIGLASFTLYQILRSSLDTYSVVLFSFWLVCALGLLIFATCSAAMVNCEAHAPLDTIFCINVSDMNLEKLAQINLFLSKLTGTQVGFSTCGLLIITKEFILTIAGMFLTYFAVLYTL